MPMSPTKAPALWCTSVAVLAFQPKRPIISRRARASHTRFGRPRTALPVASAAAACCAALPRMSDSAIASSKPTPISCGAMRGLSSVPCASGPWPSWRTR